MNIDRMMLTFIQKKGSFGHARMLFIVRKATAEDSKNESDTINFAVINEDIPVTSPFVFSFRHFYGSSGLFAVRFVGELMTLFTAYSSKVSRQTIKHGNKFNAH